MGHISHRCSRNGSLIHARNGGKSRPPSPKCWQNNDFLTSSHTDRSQTFLWHSLAGIANPERRSKTRRLHRKRPLVHTSEIMPQSRRLVNSPTASLRQNVKRMGAAKFGWSNYNFNNGHNCKSTWSLHPNGSFHPKTFISMKSQPCMEDPVYWWTEEITLYRGGCEEEHSGWETMLEWMPDLLSTRLCGKELRQTINQSKEEAVWRSQWGPMGTGI